MKGYGGGGRAWWGRSLPFGWPALERTLESSSQLAVRLAVVLIFALVALAATLGLDLLLGGFERLLGRAWPCQALVAAPSSLGQERRDP